MDRVLLRDAVRQLEATTGISSASVLGTYDVFANNQATRQFNALLDAAKEFYPTRVDIQALHKYDSDATVTKIDLNDAVRRLRIALDLRPLGSSAEMLTQVKLPSDAHSDLALDMRELEDAMSLGLTKTVLMLSGSIAEALLLLRHPDKSDKGPGLKDLLAQARKQRLFGRDTLRHLETLVDYRDLIHPRAESRNQTFRNEARVDEAIVALKLLCAELEDPEVRYESSGK